MSLWVCVRATRHKLAQPTPSSQVQEEKSAANRHKRLIPLPSVYKDTNTCVTYTIANNTNGAHTHHRQTMERIMFNRAAYERDLARYEELIAAQSAARDQGHATLCVIYSPPNKANYYVTETETATSREPAGSEGSVSTLAAHTTTTLTGSGPFRFGN
ncbi:hypothetical protein psal_cds_169 [Pandoravirus salinus]|uniref:Uncharacterized protein n=1 Tax=Pandoravirus salinus TaxID=1349410 RepID=S4W0N2_9VIRU|nr:hypothetical protein psal_cds_169 [Pandoravirus salinus]AGO83655.2 hypothetical protein psal_cds_169 [Pandoravirus salinus]